MHVLLVDYYALIRRALRTILQQVSDVHQVTEVGDGQRALEILALEQPDLVLLDIQMPHLNGLVTAKEILTKRPQQRIIFMSGHLNGEPLREALKMAAHGYVAKEAAWEEMEPAKIGRAHV